MSDLASIVVKVKVAWWLPPYLSMLNLFCLLFGTTPDMSKLDRTIHRAIKVGV